MRRSGGAQRSAEVPSSGEDITEEEMEAIKGMKSWLCTVCSKGVKEIMEEKHLLKRENAKMKEELKAVQEKNANIAKKMDELEAKWDRQGSGRNPSKPRPKSEANKWDALMDEVDEREREGMKELREEMKKLRAANEDIKQMVKDLDKRWKEREDVIVKRVTEKVMENLEEVRDRERRVKNVILFNVGESGKRESEEREKEDKEVCEYVFQDVLGVRDAKVQKVVRLGRQADGRDRPLLATVNEIGIKWALVKKSKELKHKENPDINKIIIGLDQTKKEREENNRLREELNNKILALHWVN